MYSIGNYLPNLHNLYIITFIRFITKPSLYDHVFTITIWSCFHHNCMITTMIMFAPSLWSFDFITSGPPGSVDPNIPPSKELLMVLWNKMIDLDAVNGELSDSDSSSRGDIKTSKKMLTASQVLTIFYLYIITIHIHIHLIISIINIKSQFIIPIVYLIIYYYIYAWYIT